MPKILHLTLKRKWFDMIASGEKREEYRDVKPYWINRLTWHEYHTYGQLELIKALCHKETFRKDYDLIQFRNGYYKNAPTLHVKLLGIHYGFPARMEWIDEPPGKWYFCLELGDIILFPKDHYQIINHENFGIHR